jgi:hypothetical protein
VNGESTTPEPQGKPEQQTAAPVKPITLRTFVGGISKLIALGALSHFGLLVGKALAGPNDDDCPYGHPINDGESAGAGSVLEIQITRGSAAGSALEIQKCSPNTIICYSRADPRIHSYPKGVYWAVSKLFVLRP